MMRWKTLSEWWRLGSGMMTSGDWGFWVLGFVALLGAVGIFVAAASAIQRENEAQSGCEKKGGIYHAPRGAVAVCLKPDAVLR